MLRIVYLLILSFTYSPLWAIATFDDMAETAQLSNIAYQPGDHENALKAMGHELVKQNVLPGVEVNYLFSRKAGMQYLTVRGTANLQNALVDLDIKLLEHQQLGIVAHQGFAKAAQLIISDVEPLLKSDEPIITTGHSLGGAVAVMLAMLLNNDFTIEQVITFGQPKVTNVTGAKTFSSLPLTRVVTPKDIVPLVPPISPLQIKNLDIYWHMGQEVILLEGNEYSVIEGLKSMLRATQFTTSLPNEENLNAHKMQTYLDLIALKRQQAKEIPYESGFSLFGFN